MSRSRAGGVVLWAFAAAYLLVAAWVVLWPSGVYATESVASLSRWLQEAGVPQRFTIADRVEFGLNVLLVVPAGALAVLLLRWGWERVSVAGFLASCAVELAQGLLLPARDPQAMDIVSNTLGALVGAALAALVVNAVARRGSRAR